MISGKEKWLWVVSAVVLIPLFLASSTDLLIKERETEVWPVSVIVGDATDENYVNFRKGMDQAALELHADVRFITLYTTGSWQQQRELIQREVRDGAAALVIAPVDAEAAADLTAGSQGLSPVVFLNGELGANTKADNLMFDYYGMGRREAEAIAARHGRQGPVCLFGMEEMDEAGKRFESGLQSGLEEAGCPVFHYSWSSETDKSFLDAVRQMAEDGHSPLVVAATDPQTLLRLADAFEDRKVRTAPPEGLYGRGTSVQLLNHLDQGRITGLCVTDDFTAGYMSVQYAVEQIRRDIRAESLTLDGAYIEREDLRLARYEKMLYPIE